MKWNVLFTGMSLGPVVVGNLLFSVDRCAVCDISELGRDACVQVGDGKWGKNTGFTRMSSRACRHNGGVTYERQLQVYIVLLCTAIMQSL